MESMCFDSLDQQFRSAAFGYDVRVFGVESRQLLSGGVIRYTCEDMCLVLFTRTIFGVMVNAGVGRGLLLSLD